ncbi:MAG: ATP-binding protein [Hydrogenophaga sp.]|nr:ATP-binding protein [Hydrogenophaga sp.]
MTAHSLEAGALASAVGAALAAPVAPAAPGASPNVQPLGERAGDCPVHGAFVSTGVRYFSRTEVWSACALCAAEQLQQQARERSEREQREAMERLEGAIRRAAVPPRFVGRTFDGFVADTAERQRALEVARGYAGTFAERARKGHGLVFSGMPGTGKSHLAAAVLQSIMPQRVGLYVTCMGLIRMVRNTWRRDSAQSEADVLELLAGVPLLVVDEVGVQYGTDGEQTVLFEVLDQRYQDMMPTILITNQDKDGFKGFVGERVFDRLTETSRWVAFDWESYRTQARKAGQ